MCLDTGTSSVRKESGQESECRGESRDLFQSFYRFQVRVLDKDGMGVLQLLDPDDLMGFA